MWRAQVTRKMIFLTEKNIILNKDMVEFAVKIETRKLFALINDANCIENISTININLF